MQKTFPNKKFYEISYDAWKAKQRNKDKSESKTIKFLSCAEILENIEKIIIKRDNFQKLALDENLSENLLFITNTLLYVWKTILENVFEKVKMPELPIKYAPEVKQNNDAKWIEYGKINIEVKNKRAYLIITTKSKSKRTDSPGRAAFNWTVALEIENKKLYLGSEFDKKVIFLRSEDGRSKYENTKPILEFELSGCKSLEEEIKKQNLAGIFDGSMLKNDSNTGRRTMNDNKNYYVEITNEEKHLGKTLWAADGATWHWKILKKINPGDIVFHIYTKKMPSRIVGVSIVSGKPRVEAWDKGYNNKKYENRIIVPLGQYQLLEQPILLNENFWRKLKNIDFDIKYSPFVRNKNKLNQIYCTKLNEELAKFFTEIVGIGPFYRYTPEGASLNNNKVGILDLKHQIILYGPPGTGKTWEAKALIFKELFGTEFTESEDVNEKLQKYQLSKIMEQKEINKNFWWLPSNPEEYDIVTALKKLGQIDWGMGERAPKEIKENDLIFIYEGYKVKKIVGIAKVIKIGFDKQVIDDERYILSKKEHNFKTFIRIEKIGLFDENLKAKLSWDEFKKRRLLTSEIENKLKEYLSIRNILLLNKNLPELLKYIFENLSLDIKIRIQGDAKIIWDIVQFHPSYSYEDFVRGIVAKPSKDGNGVSFEAEDKIFGIMCKLGEKLGEYDSQQNTPEDEKYKLYLIIDEINRGDISKILGELIYGLEYRGEKIMTPYEVAGDRSLTVPENLYLIGTMNTADRSIAFVDYAIRRRFAFLAKYPDESVIKEYYEDKSEIKNLALNLFRLVTAMFYIPQVNGDMEVEDRLVGHTYFLAEKGADDLLLKLKYEVVPLLEEYAKEGIGDIDKKEIEAFKENVLNKLIDDNKDDNENKGDVYNKLIGNVKELPEFDYNKIKDFIDALKDKTEKDKTAYDKFLDGVLGLKKNGNEESETSKDKHTPVIGDAADIPS